MEKNKSPLANQCSFSGIKPAMTDMPYPPLQVKEKNQGYAALLSVDYCGCVSEMSAIAQYINNEKTAVDACLSDNSRIAQRYAGGRY